MQRRRSGRECDAMEERDGSVMQEWWKVKAKGATKECSRWVLVSGAGGYGKNKERARLEERRD